MIVATSWSRSKPTRAEAEAIEADATAHEPLAPDLEDPSLYFNRELSWLDFNDRVLQLAEDPSVPLLERVKFCAIWESNLDEFFMVRVAEPARPARGRAGARGADGMHARAARSTRCASGSSASASASRGCFERELRPALAEHGIRIIPP